MALSNIHTDYPFFKSLLYDLQLFDCYREGIELIRIMKSMLPLLKDLNQLDEESDLLNVALPLTKKEYGIEKVREQYKQFGEKKVLNEQRVLVNLRFKLLETKCWDRDQSKDKSKLFIKDIVELKENLNKEQKIKLKWEVLNNLDENSLNEDDVVGYLKLNFDYLIYLMEVLDNDVLKEYDLNITTVPIKSKIQIYRNLSKANLIFKLIKVIFRIIECFDSLEKLDEMEYFIDFGIALTKDWIKDVYLKLFIKLMESYLKQNKLGEVDDEIEGIQREWKLEGDDKVKLELIKAKSLIIQCRYSEAYEVYKGVLKEEDLMNIYFIRDDNDKDNILMEYINLSISCFHTNDKLEVGLRILNKVKGLIKTNHTVNVHYWNAKLEAYKALAKDFQPFKVLKEKGKFTLCIYIYLFTLICFDF